MTIFLSIDIIYKVSDSVDSATSCFTDLFHKDQRSSLFRSWKWNDVLNSLRTNYPIIMSRHDNILLYDCSHSLVEHFTLTMVSTLLGLSIDICILCCAMLRNHIWVLFSIDYSVLLP